MNESLLGADRRKKATAAWQASRAAPFSHLLLPNAFDSLTLAAARDELAARAAFRTLSNDLYSFEQTRELRAMPGGALERLIAAIYGEPFRDWLREVTGLPLSGTVDISVARYSFGSHLLCHDDDLAERRVAFIIYLVPEAGWDIARDGGALELFDTAPDVAAALGGDPAKLVLPPAALPGSQSGSCFLPGNVVKRLTPAWNSLALFEVSAVSHHAVAEVLSTSAPRMSISGWLHGPPLERPPMPSLSKPALAEPLDLLQPPPQARAMIGGKRARVAAAAASVSAATTDVPPLASVLNVTYLRPSVLQQARARFTNDASLLLTGLLQASALAAARADLSDQRWLPCGPANMRRYRVAAGLCYPSAGMLAKEFAPGGSRRSGTSSALRSLFRHLASAEFRGFLECVTGARLGACTGEVRSFCVGEYTLLHDEGTRRARVEAKRRAVLDSATGSAASKSSATTAAASDAAAAVDASSTAPATASTRRMFSDKAEPASDASDAWLRAQLLPLPRSEPLLEVCLSLTDPADDAKWADAAAAGGSIVFLTADEELLTVPPAGNSLSLVLREPAVMSFVKYVSAAAPAVRYDIAMTYAVVG